jgi:Tfp pilus assembly protein PilO
MKFKEAFSGKRSAIEQAKSVVLIWVVVASVLVSFSLVGINFLWNLRGYNSRVVGAKREAEDTLRQNLANAPQLQQNYQLLEDSEINSQDVLDALPSRYDFPALATSVASLVTRSGLVIESFNGDDLGESAVQNMASPTPVDMPFQLTVEGSYDDVKKFIENLNRSIRVMKIEKLSLSGTNANMQAELEITSFYQPAVSINSETVEVK